MDSFVHLHVHLRKSLLDGLGDPMQAAYTAYRLGMPALALTDHGNLNDASAMWEACQQHEIKYIAGCEFYLAPGSRHLKEKVRWGSAEAPGDVDLSGNGAYTHLTVLAANSAGVRNLFALQHLAYSDGFYRKPRIDLESLEEHRDGLIVLSGCASSAISTRLRLGQVGEADKLMEFYRQTFGENFFVEVMTHGIDFEADLNRQLIGIAERHGTPTVATNDSHYCTAEQAPIHRALLCVQTQSTIAAPKMQFSGSGYFLRSLAQMEALGLPAGSLARTLDIAERVERYSGVFEHKLRMPVYPVPDGWTSEDALISVATDGLAARLGRPVPDEYARPLEEQLDVINGMGYPDYFLVKGSILSEAKRRGIRVGPGRGSVGGNLVAYALGITDLDPIAHGLLSERFLNHKRRSLPDIDSDVDAERRDEVIEIARELYGDDLVAQITTYGTIGAKAALKDAVRVHGGSPAEGERRVSYLPPPRAGRPPGIDAYIGPDDEIYDTAKGLYGAVRNESVHASAVVIAPEPLAGLLPLRRTGGKGPNITGYTDKETESIGLVKMDFLGLRNLTVIEDATERIVAGGYGRPTLPLLPDECNDRKTYEILSSGNTLGVFQFDSPSMRGLLRLLKPENFNDITAVLALFRPGPMGAGAHTEYAHRKRQGGWDSEWAIHPDLEEALRPVLAGTYGLIVFQEQVMQVLNAVCGWSYAEADNLLNAMRKKDHAKMEATKPEYFSSGETQGFNRAALSALWEILVPFADYSFNRAHSAGYGLVAYWTAFLKANHPTEYMASLLSSVADDPDHLPEYLAECRRLGIKILPPNVNFSGVGFQSGDMGIHYGPDAIKGVGPAVVNALAKKAPYSSVNDFFRRVDAKVLNAGSLKALVKGGAFDSLCPYREELYLAAETLALRATVYRQETKNGQKSLFGVWFGVGDSGLYSVSTRQLWEQEVLSTVVTEDLVSLVAKRRLLEAELVWLRSVISQHPGQTGLRMLIGAATIMLPAADWPAIEPAIESLGVFDVLPPAAQTGPSPLRDAPDAIETGID